MKFDGEKNLTQTCIISTINLDYIEIFLHTFVHQNDYTKKKIVQSVCLI